jgi:hypothetical protein
MPAASKRQGPTISTAAPEHLALDYEALRLEGIRQLERLAGTVWTDYNAHDPGITILEQLCYAITDLAYRISYDLRDLIVEPGERPFPHLFTPAEILPSAPVTTTDLRKVILDVDGVRNAWIEPLQETRPALYYHEGRHELSLRADDETAEAVNLRGLYRVLIEKSEVSWRGGALVENEVSRRLHAVRGLCEDFAEIVVLDPQDARVHAEIEIDLVEDPEAVLLAVYQAIADYMSPTIRFKSLDELLAAGQRVDAIFEGPLLEHGFIDGDELRRLARRVDLHTSDLIQKIMRLRGVRAVRRIALSLEGGAQEPWTVCVGEGRVPRLVLTELGAQPGLTIKLLRDRVTVAVDESAVVDGYRQWLTGRGKGPPLPAAARDLRPSGGRDRDVARYRSIQRHFPATYGIGEVGLPASASAERRAYAQQLRAYLTIFDQVLANCFAQLAHVRKLFAFDSDTRSYRAQAVGDPAIGPAEVWRGAAPDDAAIQALVEATTPGGGTSERRHRLLNHLLARFSEQLTDYSLLLYGAIRGGEGGLDAAAVKARLAEDKAGFLRDYPRISRSRGTALNLLKPPGPDNRSGLGDRLRRKLGLRDADEEDFVVVEHILLRPMVEDRAQHQDASGERIPLLAATRTKDPYSLQLSVVFTDWPLRLRDPGFRQFIEQTVREEVPAHLIVYVHWVDRDGWAAIGAARDRWLALRRERATL